MQKFMYLSIGLILGFSIFAVAQYYFNSGLELSYEFFLGMLLSTFLFGILSVSLFFYYVNRRKAFQNELQEQYFTTLLSSLLPSLNDQNINRIKSIVSNVLKYRAFYLGVRVLFSLIIVMGGMIGTYVLIKQNTLLEIQNDKIEAQNTLFDKQNDLVSSQNTLLQTQSRYLESQTSLFDSQNDLIATQNDQIGTQNRFAQKEYYRELVSSYRNQLSSPDFSNETKLNAFNRIYQLTAQAKTNLEEEVIDVKNTSFNRLEITNKVIRDFSFTNSSFYETLIENSSFSNCSFKASHFSDTRLKNVRIVNAIFNDVSFSLTNRTPSQEYALKQAAKYLKYNGFPITFSGIIEIDNTVFQRCDFRYTDLRNISGINNETFKLADIEAGLFYGAIINSEQIGDMTTIQVMKDNGVIFNQEDLARLLKEINSYNLTDQEKEAIDKIIMYYQEITF